VSAAKSLDMVSHVMLSTKNVGKVVDKGCMAQIAHLGRAAVCEGRGERGGPCGLLCLFEARRRVSPSASLSQARSMAPPKGQRGAASRRLMRDFH